MVERIQKEWKFAFDVFGYDLQYKDTSSAEDNIQESLPKVDWPFTPCSIMLALILIFIALGFQYESI